MKKLLVVLMALGSISTFAQEITDFQKGYNQAVEDIDKKEFWICSLNNQHFEYSSKKKYGYVFDKVISQIEFIDFSEGGFSRGIALSKLKDKCDSLTDDFKVNERNKVKEFGANSYSEYSEWKSKESISLYELIDKGLKYEHITRFACNELLVSQKTKCIKL